MLPYLPSWTFSPHLWIHRKTLLLLSSIQSNQTLRIKLKPLKPALKNRVYSLRLCWATLNRRSQKIHSRQAISAISRQPKKHIMMKFRTWLFLMPAKTQALLHLRTNCPLMRLKTKQMTPDMQLVSYPWIRSWLKLKQHWLLAKLICRHWRPKLMLSLLLKRLMKLTLSYCRQVTRLWAHVQTASQLLIKESPS